MIYKADFSFTLSLLALPETGMGYQIIEAQRPNRAYREQFVVLNSELIIEKDSGFLESKRQLLYDGYTRMFATVGVIQLSAPTLVSRSSIREVRALSDSKQKEQKRNTGGKGATESAKENASGEEMFVRLSAFENDKRVDLINKRFLPGTFATSTGDYSECKNSNDDPIDRYSLPNDDKIQWVFYAIPIKPDQLQRGIVQPANFHDGGGIEIFFEVGTSPDTYIAKKPY